MIDVPELRGQGPGKRVRTKYPRRLLGNLFPLRENRFEAVGRPCPGDTTPGSCGRLGHPVIDSAEALPAAACTSESARRAPSPKSPPPSLHRS